MVGSHNLQLQTRKDANEKGKQIAEFGWSEGGDKKDIILQLQVNLAVYCISKYSVILINDFMASIWLSVTNL